MRSPWHRRCARAAPWLAAALVGGFQYRYLMLGWVQCARDLFGQEFSETWFLLQRLRAFDLALWLPGARLGQPFLALLYTQVLYLPRVFFALLGGEVRGPNWMHAFHAFWSFAGSFLAARRLGLGRVAAFVAAAPFALGPAFAVFALNLQYASACSWAGWNLWASLRLHASPSARRLALLTLTLGGTVLAGAPEMVLWQAAMVLLVSKARGLVALGWSGLLCAVVLLPAAELALESSRPGAVPAGQLEWSVSVPQLLSMALPEADRPRGDIWGDDQSFVGSLFIGSVTLMLAAAALTRKRARPLLILAVGCALLSLGRHFWLSELVLRLPLLNLFRYPVKYAEGALFAVSMLAGVGAQRLGAQTKRLLLHRQAADERGGLEPFAAGTVGLACGLFVASRAFTVREGFVSAAAWSLCMALMFAAVLASRRNVPAFAAMLVGFEALVAPREPLVLCSVETLTAPSPVAAQLRADGVGRISTWVDREEDPAWCQPSAAATVVTTSKQRLSVLRFLEENLRAVGGYGFRDPWRPAQAFAQGSTAYALAGVTHFVLNTWGAPPFKGPTPEQTAIDDIWVWKTTDAFPRSWFVTSATQVTADEVLTALRGPSERFRREVLAEVPVNPGSGAHCSSTVTLDEPRAEHIVEQVDACDDGFVVLADAWYPGWQVTVDGTSAQAFLANGFLRAVAVPKGRHVLEWRYRPWSVRLGAWLSLAGLLALGWVAFQKVFKPLGSARA